ncbi:50S ribosomal protein L25/general stress protein Ctc [Alcanivorax balearicus MACL04]|uniref:Large ribosomal subunit protein bL25 n=1 Tax=Alloalcanivorax balearicus MACL04 TaxID=1177182 RepID=A0ABT2QWT4_9GAMM|nr:50S ribosomal protein L25/general stress protein Ctc [Alloalcanivorax balearicus]MCU5781991.1 50S ribosomal protein L25/general stress protein Ctc [Alloalcanivorax balearicus MACL04]
MSNEFVLNAEARSDKGKGASRRLRRLQDRVPAVLYGGTAEPTMLSLEMRELRKALENEAFYSHVLTLQLEGKEHQAVLRDLQRHPSSGFPIHADFLRVDTSHAITMTVPLHFINEETSVGVKKEGGEIHHNVSEVQVSCLPQDLPEFIEVDMADVALEQVVHLSDLVLPKGVTLVELSHGESHDQPVAAVHKPKVRGGSDDAEEGGEAEEGEGQE